MGTDVMRRIALGTLSSLVLALGLAGQASAGGITEVAVNDNSFSPDDALDLSFRFAWDPTGDAMTSNPHNVRQDVRFFASGAPTTGDGDFEVLLPGAGTYHYYCEVHGSPTGGMDGVIRNYLYSLSQDVDPGESRRVRWTPAGDTGSHTFDVQYRVDGGPWKNWKKDTPKRRAKFGANNKPVNFNNARTYEVRARTQKNGNVRKRSGWSQPYTLEDV